MEDTYQDFCAGSFQWNILGFSENFLNKKVFKEIQESSRRVFALMDNKWFAGSYRGSSGHSITSFLCANTLQSHLVVKQAAGFKEWYIRLYFSFHLLLSLFELGVPSSCWSQNSVGPKNWATLPFSRSHGSSLMALDQPCYVTFKTSPFITHNEGGWPLVQEIHTYVQPKPALNRFERNRAFKRQMQMIIGKCLKILYKLSREKKGKYI